MIRLADPADQLAVEACVADAYEKYRPMINRTPGPMLDDYAALIADGFVDVDERPDATGNPEIVGVMVAFGEPHDVPDHYEIETLAVLERCQRMGIGRDLLQLAERRAGERGIPWARLYTNEVMEDNREWYLRAGYTIYERRNDRGYNRIFFEKQIAEIAVRPLRRGEGAVLREIRLRALTDAPEAFASTLQEARERTDDSWESMITGGDVDSRRWVAICDGGTVGLVGSYRSEAGIELISMWTDPGVRGRGVGGMLVDAVVCAAGPEPVGLWVMRGNESAVRLYERCGFVVDVDFSASADDPCHSEIRMIRRSPATGSSA